MASINIRPHRQSRRLPGTHTAGNQPFTACFTRKCLQVRNGWRQSRVWWLEKHLSMFQCGWKIRFRMPCAIKRWEIEAQVWFIMTVKQQLKLNKMNFTQNIIGNYTIESCRDAHISPKKQHDLIAPVRGIFGSTWRPKDRDMWLYQGMSMYITVCGAYQHIIAISPFWQRMGHAKAYQGW